MQPLPHLAFYAARDDIRVIIDFAVEEVGCTIFESYSVPDHHLRELPSTDSVLSAFDAEPGGLLVVLYSSSMRGQHRIRRIALERNAIPGATWRESIDGWGLIQLVVPRLIAGNLRVSHTNHNSEARARSWAGEHPEIPSVDDWDFKEVTRISSKLNRFIRKHAVDQHEGTVVLSGAKALSSQGSITLIR